MRIELHEKEIYLGAYLNEDQTFKVYVEFEFPHIYWFPIVIVSDMKHVPWPRKEGNLLW